ncbi:PAS domain S-box-containing protein [Hoeflea halophila]|uniref:Blue-light-activated histidine kinase n=1 Tax=Hoeflea halophila TaxID=714899 RepID=A0A286IFK0_9HYPH|nr:PAS domain S-box protein [Hoeflea halophila]SOE18908.1 PAS domain S-box-containing protein [Hoeflea halophila]
MATRIEVQETAGEILAELPCGVVSTLEDGTIVRVNRTFLNWTGLTADVIDNGKRFQELLTVPGRIFYETHFAPLLLMQGGVKEVACQLKRGDKEPIHVLLNSMVVEGRKDLPRLIRTVVFDATDRFKYEQELRRGRNESRQLAAIVQASSDGIVSAGLDGVVRTWNPGATRMFGYTEAEAVGRSVDDLIVPVDRKQEREEKYRKIRSGEHVTFSDTARQHKDGRLVPVEITATPMVDDHGRVIAASLIFRDISDRKLAEEKQRLLMGELNHRVKNLLSVVQVVARQTASVSDATTFGTRLSERLLGLAACQDLLVQSNWQGAELSELVSAQLAHFSDMIGIRIFIDGPEIKISPDVTQGLGMALHELATNAAKYGALSNATGCVKISWQIREDPDLRFSIQWVERGGPPVQIPTREGFGNKVLRRMVEASVKGKVSLDYPPDGLRWKLEAKLSDITAD